MKLAKLTVAIGQEKLPSSPPSELPIPEKILLPLEGPWGTAEAAVSVGESVQAGGVIGKFKDPRLPWIRTPLSGTVEGIQEFNAAAGRKVRGVVIRVSGNGTEPGAGVPASTEDPAKLAQVLVEAGFSEMEAHPWPFPARICSPETASAAFQLTESPFDKPVETLLVNALDRQPGELIRKAVLQHWAEDIARAVPALKALSQARQIVLAYDAGFSLSADLSRKLQELGVVLRPMENRYPSALTPLLVQLTTGKEVPQPANDPRLVGVAVVDVDVVRQLGVFLDRGAAPLDAVVQAASWKTGFHEIFVAKIGTPLSQLLQRMENAGNARKIIVGGPFLGNAQFDTLVPLTASTSVFVLRGEEVSSYNYRACVSCGQCVSVCPMKLLPNELGKLCEFDRFMDAEANGLEHCIECGLCAYVCPAKRPMVQLMRHGKHELMKMRKES